MLDRRTLLWGALAMPAIGFARSAAAASWGQDFAVSRDGSPIGRHGLRFTQDGARTTAEITIELQVKIAFITVYRYRHVNREIWDGDDLLSFASRTDDNGTAHRVQARRSGDRILVESDQGTVEAPADALPTTYWHRRFLDRAAMDRHPERPPAELQRQLTRGRADHGTRPRGRGRPVRGGGRSAARPLVCRGAVGQARVSRAPTARRSTTASSAATGRRPPPPRDRHPALRPGRPARSADRRPAGPRPWHATPC